MPELQKSFERLSRREPIVQEEEAISSEHERATESNHIGNQAMQQIAGTGGAAAVGAVLGAQGQGLGNQAIQRIASGLTDERPADTAEQIRSAGGGQAMDAGVQRKLEGSLGADLSGVRVHTDGQADSLSKSVSAAAFTSGSDIFFGAGNYNPGTESGMHMLAHEATHIVQQRSGPVAGTPSAGGVSISDPNDSFERAADASAPQVVSGAKSGGDAGGGAAVQGMFVQREGPEEEKAVQGMFIQREGEDEKDVQTYVQREGEDEKDVQTYVQREGEDEKDVQTYVQRMALQREGAEDEKMA